MHLNRFGFLNRVFQSLCPCDSTSSSEASVSAIWVARYASRSQSLGWPKMRRSASRALSVFPFRMSQTG